jgi:bacteriocin-like protein
MSDAPKPARDRLTMTTEAGKIELTEKELSRVTGGTVDIFAKIGEIKGESTISSHTSVLPKTTIG